MMKKIIFLTGTRADFGKMKTLMKAVDDNPNFLCYIFVTGMHLIEEYGNTYIEVEKENFKNVYKVRNQNYKDNDMLKTLARTIEIFSDYVKVINPDLIIVHGDRLEALAGAIVGAFSNILVAHIEGGEVSGTIDEVIRHAVTKFSHIHFVANEEAKRRVIQLGENEKAIKIIGSPDIDVMLSDKLPTLSEVKKAYDIPFKKYSIFLFHPVVSEVRHLKQDIQTVVDTLIKSKKNYIVIFPNNDSGTDIIMEEFKRLTTPNFKVFPSIRFERFLTLLKNCDFIIGNSSAGVRESSIYGVPAIDLGTRQSGRYAHSLAKNIIHCDIDSQEIMEAINNAHKYRNKSLTFGNGNSTEAFISAIEDPELWDVPIQKRFIDLDRR